MKAEPTRKEIEKFMKERLEETYYTAREKLRAIAYGGHEEAKPPGGYQSWGDYWKSY